MNASSTKRSSSSKAKVLVLALTVVLLFAVALVAVGCGETESQPTPVKRTTKAKLYSADELVIPEHLEQDRLFGLFFYDADGVHYTRSTENMSKVNFDPNKPTAIFIHGMQMNTGWNGFDEIYNPIGWLNAGYNFGVFLWSQVADCGMPSEGKSRIWYGNSQFFYCDEDGNRQEETEDLLKYPTAMVFGAYYFDFMNRVTDYKGSSISIIGHSLGANTNIAIGSYFFTLYDQGTITKEFLPDRFVYLDAYMDAITETKTIVPWLNKPIGEGGVVQKGIEVAQKAQSLGISTEYLKSYKGVSYLSDSELYGGKPGTCDNYFSKLLYVDMKEGGDFFASHVNSMEWYLKAMTAEKEPVIDRSFQSSNFPAYYDEETGYSFPSDFAIDEGTIGWGPTTPISVTYARIKSAYKMPAKNGKSQTSTNINKPIVAGFAFDDYNNDGVYNERLQARVAGVTVELYQGETKLGEVVTDESGAYRFEIDESFAGKTFTVKATLPDGKTFTGKVAANSTADALTKAFMSNGINANGSSDSFSFVDKVQIKIVNVGVKHE